ncbi:DUF928 domain-containing protein [Ancylothrix sp. C2]|uniref:DUF928 domain-containing protein n=1 Tax=Ancylothrix sp. D3o TaxID=2953691 RepID=UPI0021BB11A4|nr:DUF928 domain-containing protein [Ancylothrix sp. D3o]MCT7948627.1 DUF928 domain-containing protein [Ancylothrix sp. D3o]
MNTKQSCQRLAMSVAAVVLGIAVYPGLTRPANATTQTASLNLNSINQQLISQTFQPPDRGAPPRTADGGSRGCGLVKPGQKGLTALTPGNSLPLTVSEKPTFFWYVPASTAVRLEFTLMDETDSQVIYTTKIPLPSKAGIVGFTLPKTNAPALKIGKMYHWYLAMVCDSNDRTGDTVVDGWIERTVQSASLTEQLNQANSLSEQAAVYADAGIWHEAVSTLAKLRQNQPENQELLNSWERLLRSVELERFAQEPVVDTIEISQE